MLSTASRQRADRHIRRALPAGQSPWEALDSYRRRGGRIHWHDWFRLWKAIANEPGTAVRRGPLASSVPRGR